MQLWQQTVEPQYSRLFDDLASVARSMKVALYMVGGFLRDLIIGQLGNRRVDLDIVIEGDAVAFAQALQNIHGGEMRIHKRFGTANWFVDRIKSRWISDSETLPDSLDLISTRKERYKHAGALPTVTLGNITDDIDRRDFSINTLAIRLDSEKPALIDRHHALKDIQTGIIRILHEYSFIDDPTRILRAVRYEQRYGFTFDAATFHLLRSGSEYINRVSGDRIRHEIDHILEEHNFIDILKRLDDLGILAQVHQDFSFRGPQMSRVAKVMEEFERLSFTSDIEHMQKKLKMIYAAWFSSYDRIIGQGIAARINLPRSMIRILDGYYSILGRRDFIKVSEPIDVTEFLDTIPAQSVHLALLLEEDSGLKDKIILYIDHWQNVRTEIKGNDLLNRQITPGPKYSTILRRLRAARLNGIIHSRQEEYRYLEKLLVEIDRNGT